MEKEGSPEICHIVPGKKLCWWKVTWRSASCCTIGFPAIRWPTVCDRAISWRTIPFSTLSWPAIGRIVISWPFWWLFFCNTSNPLASWPASCLLLANSWPASSWQIVKRPVVLRWWRLFRERFRSAEERFYRQFAQCWRRTVRRRGQAKQPRPGRNYSSAKRCRGQIWSVLPPVRYKFWTTRGRAQVPLRSWSLQRVAAPAVHGGNGQGVALLRHLRLRGVLLRADAAQTHRGEAQQGAGLSAPAHLGESGVFQRSRRRIQLKGFQKLSLVTLKICTLLKTRFHITFLISSICT